jgi:DNA-binding response OmpR family regulator
MKVLVIDDDEEITEVIKFYLEQLGADCKTINNGKDGLLAIQNEDSDLILLDVAMPEFTVDIVQSLKRDGLIETKNIVVMTASSDKIILQQVVESGIREILMKPCSLEELTALIERYRKNTRETKFLATLFFISLTKLG